MDVLAVPLHRSTLYQFGISLNKLFDYMLAAKPILQASDASNDLVAEAGCGLTVPPEEPAAFADAVLRLRGLSEDERRRADFCVEALEEALSRYGRPEIFNTDQGSQFTSDDFVGTLKRHGIMISMDGKGRCMDNIFVERLWRSLKYEEVVCCESLASA
jgi:hypothetical protein